MYIYSSCVWVNSHTLTSLLTFFTSFAFLLKHFGFLTRKVKQLHFLIQDLIFEAFYYFLIWLKNEGFLEKCDIRHYLIQYFFFLNNLLAYNIVSIVAVIVVLYRKKQVLTSPFDHQITSTR